MARLLYFFPDRIETNSAGGHELRWPAGVEPFGGAPAPGFNSELYAVVVLPAALSHDECARVRTLGEARAAQRAQVERGHTVDYRASTIAWIEPHEDARWLYHRLGALFLEANRRYRFDLTGFVDALQYTVYGADDRFDWHIDLGPEATSTRKLSLSVLLNAEGEYDGGRLEFANLGRTQEVLPGGTAVFFPSYMMHRVSPIVRGTRRALVAWGAGAPFR